MFPYHVIALDMNRGTGHLG